MSKSIKQHMGTEVEIELLVCGRAFNEYEVRLLSGKWPVIKSSLAVMCDGGDPSRPLEDQMFEEWDCKDTEDPNQRIVRVFK